MLSTDILAMRGDIEAIRTATSYCPGSYLTHGTAHDSSIRKNNRMLYVDAAQKQFIKEHQVEILQLAASLVESELRDAAAVLNNMLTSGESP